MIECLFLFGVALNEKTYSRCSVVEMTYFTSSFQNHFLTFPFQFLFLFCFFHTSFLPSFLFRNGVISFQTFCVLVSLRHKTCFSRLQSLSLPLHLDRVSLECHYQKPRCRLRGRFRDVRAKNDLPEIESHRCRLRGSFSFLRVSPSRQIIRQHSGSRSTRGRFFR